MNMLPLGVDVVRQSPETVERATEAAMAHGIALRDSLITNVQRSLFDNYQSAVAEREQIIQRESASASRTFRLLYLGAGLLVGGAAGYYAGKRK